MAWVALVLGAVLLAGLVGGVVFFSRVDTWVAKLEARLAIKIPPLPKSLRIFLLFPAIGVVYWLVRMRYGDRDMLASYVWSRTRRMAERGEYDWASVRKLEKHLSAQFPGVEALVRLHDRVEREPIRDEDDEDDV